MGESEGRAFLLEKYNLYLDGIRKQTSSSGESRRELELLGDARLIAALEAKADAEPPGVPKNNINTLLDVIRGSAMPADQLMAVATNGTYTNVNVRLHAIRVMSRQGEVDLLPFLESLRSSPEDYDRANWNKLRRFAIEDAILRIRMRDRK